MTEMSVNRYVTLLILLSLSVTFGYGQKDNDTTNINIQQITVVAQKQTPYETAAKQVTTIDSSLLETNIRLALTDILENFGAIDIRQRGGDDTQADISIRGSSFDQVAILIDGVNFTDFQTGHYNLDLPVPLFSIEKIRIIEGPAARFYGAGALAGAVDIITVSGIEENILKTNLEFGQYGLGKLETALMLSVDNISGSLDIYKSVSNGYTTNTDYDINKVFLTFNRVSPLGYGTVSLRSGYLDKSYGAYNFYTPLYPYQYEKIRSFLNLLGYQTPDNFPVKLKTSIYQRTHYDIFELFREDRGWYVRTDSGYFVMNGDTAKFYPDIYEPWNYYRSHNFHITNLYGATVRSQFSTGKHLDIFTGAEIRYQQIRSNRLGLPSDTVKFPFYPGAYLDKSASRTNASFYANVRLKLGKLVASAGVFDFYGSQYGNHLLGGADISLNLKNTKLYASINQALREPTFTELYYQGPANQGNPDLQPETATTYEAGLETQGKLQVKSALFYRKGQNIIDWVRQSATDKWQAANYTRLDTYGFELFAGMTTGNPLIRHIQLVYKYTDQTKTTGTLLSKYVLDYLKHYAALYIDGRKKRNGWNLNIIFADRNGSFEWYDPQTQSFSERPYEPYLLVNLTLYHDFNKTRAYIAADNLLNWHYYDISNVALPGIWIKFGISSTINLDNKK